MQPLGKGPVEPAKRRDDDRIVGKGGKSNRMSESGGHAGHVRGGRPTSRSIRSTLEHLPAIGGEDLRSEVADERELRRR